MPWANQYLVRNFPPGSNDAAAAWLNANRNPDNGFSDPRLSLATCESVGVSTSCAAFDMPVCGTINGSATTYRSDCYFRVGTLHEAGVTGEAAGATTSGACGPHKRLCPTCPDLLWTLPQAIGATLSTDGTLLVLDVNYTMPQASVLHRISPSGTFLSDQPFDASSLDATLLSIAPLSLVDGVFGQFMVQSGQAGFVQPTSTEVLSLPSCSGAPNWNVRVGGSIGRFGPGGDVYLAGTDTLNQMLVTKLAAADGHVLWSVVLDNTPPDSNFRRESLLDKMVVDAAGNIYVTGYVFFFSPSAGDFQANSVTAKVDGHGNVVWRRVREFEYGRAIAVDDAGRVTTAAITRANSFGGDTNNVIVTQFESDGKVRWSWESDVFANEFKVEMPPTIAIAANGTVLIALTNSNGSFPFFPTVLIALGSDGAVIWHGFETGLSRVVADKAGAFYLIGGEGIRKYQL